LDKSTIDRIETLSPSIEKFLELHPDEQEWLYPMLGKAEKRCIDMLIALQGRYLTYIQVAVLVNCHPSTAKSTLYALQRGGIGISQDKTGKFSTPKGGRYRAIKKIGN
jgi:hypothetical protein